MQNFEINIIFFFWGGGGRGGRGGISLFGLKGDVRPDRVPFLGALS